jgi:hypothetical protein
MAETWAECVCSGAMSRDALFLLEPHLASPESLPMLMTLDNDLSSFEVLSAISLYRRPF